VPVKSWNALLEVLPPESSCCCSLSGCGAESTVGEGDGFVAARCPVVVLSLLLVKEMGSYADADVWRVLKLD